MYVHSQVRSQDLRFAGKMHFRGASLLIFVVCLKQIFLRTTKFGGHNPQMWLQLFQTDKQTAPYQFPMMSPCSELDETFLLVERKVSYVYVTRCFKKSWRKPLDFSSMVNNEVSLQHLIKCVNGAAHRNNDKPDNLFDIEQKQSVLFCYFSERLITSPK